MGSQVANSSLELGTYTTLCTISCLAERSAHEQSPLFLWSVSESALEVVPTLSKGKTPLGYLLKCSCTPTPYLKLTSRGRDLVT